MRLCLSLLSCSILFFLLSTLASGSTETLQISANDTDEAHHLENNVINEEDDSEFDEGDFEEDSSFLENVKNRDNFVDELFPDSKQLNPSVIDNSFNNKKTFSCPRIKSDLVTGSNIGDLSPEDIGIIAAMGDSLSTGIGLWPRTDIEFRGASFSSGGDATIDGLITIPNILREFNPDLHGVSHGMGTAEQLPEHQLNVAASNARMHQLPAQAHELVRRLELLGDVNYKQEWVMVIITIGTEEVCKSCSGADYESIDAALKILHLGIPKAFVVLLGPLHVSSNRNQDENWLSMRCDCLQSDNQRVVASWTDVFERIQSHYSRGGYDTFGVQALPFLTITSRYPRGLFLPKRPLLNRRGHMYATKWLWNRLIAGNKYNLSEAILSQDTYFCPSSGCPYFRTSANRDGCQLLSLQEAKEKFLTISKDGKTVHKLRRRTPKMLYTVALVVVGIAFCAVFALGTIFYQRSKQGDHGRFEVIDEVQLKFEEAQKEEERTLLSRQSIRAVSSDVLARAPSMSSRRLVSECEAGTPNSLLLP